jgi:hypothetical protein
MGTCAHRGYTVPAPADVDDNDVWDVTVVEELGKGREGVAELVKHNVTGQEYVRKRQFFAHGETVNSVRTEVDHEDAFYNVIDQMTAEQRSYFVPCIASRVRSEANGDVVCERLMARKTGSLASLVGDGTVVIAPAMRASIVAQTMYALIIMRRRGYSHNDVHLGNFLYEYVDDDAVFVMEDAIVSCCCCSLSPTFVTRAPCCGIRVSLVDYGGVFHNDDDGQSTYWWSWQRDRYCLFRQLILLADIMYPDDNVSQSDALRYLRVKRPQAYEEMKAFMCEKFPSLNKDEDVEWFADLENPANKTDVSEVVATEDSMPDVAWCIVTQWEVDRRKEACRAMGGVYVPAFLPDANDVAALWNIQFDPKNDMGNVDVFFLANMLHTYEV